MMAQRSHLKRIVSASTTTLTDRTNNHKSEPMKTRIHIPSLFIAACLGASAPVFADPFTFTNGDLILGFQATAGQGTTTNVFFNLGPAISHRDNGNLGVLGTIGSTLSAAYGNDWYSREDLYFGVFGNLNFVQATGIGGQGPVDGDPTRTVYVSRAAAAPGQALAWTGYTATGLGNAGGSFSGMEQMVVQLTVNADNSANLDQTTEPSKWNNGWTYHNPPNAAFGVFTGGIQQNFGKGGSATYLDVQRILGYTTGASPTGPIGTGTYETTISISPTGVITASSSSTSSSAFTTWIDGYTTQLPNAADREAGADPDQDGIDNLMEFVLNGNPSVSGQAILPALNASGTNFVFSFTRRADSADEMTQVFEYSTNLVDWTTKAPITIPDAPGAVGFVTVGPNTGTPPNEVQAVSISIPKGTDTKLFGRLKVVK